MLARTVSIHPRDSSRTFLEDRLGPLNDCRYRRGHGWITLFQASMAKTVKKALRGISLQALSLQEEGENPINYRGSFIDLELDWALSRSLHLQRASWPGSLAS